MARIIYKQNPLDLNQRKIVGFSLPLTGVGGFNPTYQTKDQIKTNLINYLLTNNNERVFNPEFGANLRSLLFENITKNHLEEVKNKIQNEIRFKFSLIKINKITLTPDEDNNTIYFYLSYSIPEFRFDDELKILIQ